jgi:hypothetical protein
MTTWKFNNRLMIPTIPALFGVNWNHQQRRKHSSPRWEIHKKRIITLLLVFKAGIPVTPISGDTSV